MTLRPRTSSPLLAALTLCAAGAIRRSPPHRHTRWARRCPRTCTRRTSRPGPPTASPPIAQQSGARYFTLAFVEVADEGLMHAGMERRRDPDDGRRPVPVRHRQPARDRRRRDPVVRRFQRRQRRHRTRRLLHRRQPDRRGLRVGDHHLQRDPPGHGRRGEVAVQRRRHRPAQQGDQDRRGLGRRRRGARCRSPTRCRSNPPGWNPTASPCCRTRSRTTRASTSSTS